MQVTADAQREWLWGWDSTPGIVSVWAESDGRAFVWRRDPASLALIREDVRFRPWILLASLQDIAHLGDKLRPESERPLGRMHYTELSGPGALRYLVHGDDSRSLRNAVLQGASRRLNRRIDSLRELGEDYALSLAPEEQYLVASGRTHFRALEYDALQRLQFDLETTGLDPEHDRIFLIALRGPGGESEVIESRDEAELLLRFCARVRELDPDVIENHNLHGFDLPFVVRRSERLGVPLALGRLDGVGFRRRPAARGARLGNKGSSHDRDKRLRFTLPGRELIDTMDAVRRYDFASRELPSHGLKAVARFFGLASPDREYVPGAEVHATYLRDPERVRRYACDDVHEAAGVARLLGGAAFALARLAPRRYERLADAGPATGVLDPLLVRAYLRAGAALPAQEPSDGTEHSGAALYLFATGVAHRIVKADVASLYPSLMREYRIGPRRDRLGVLLALVDQLVDQRLAAKARAKAAAPGSAERHTQEALSAAMKIVVNSAYGYLGAVGLTRFADVHAANEVTRHGREVLARLCSEFARRGVTLLEADTDGVYFAVPESFDEADERRIVAEVAALLPERVQLEFDGRYAAMLSHEPKNYALAAYGGGLTLRGVAFRSSRAEPFGSAFLRKSVERLLAGDIAGVREAYVETALALRRRQLPAHAVAARVRLTKEPGEYIGTRGQRRELPYEALLTAGRTNWRAGDTIRVYRAAEGRAGLLRERPADHSGDRDDAGGDDPRDYDVEYYLHVLKDTFAARLARGLRAEDYAYVVEDPLQPSLFERSLSDARPILTVLRTTPDLGTD